MSSWFWLVGAVVLSLMPPLVKNTLGGSEEVVTVFLTIFSISIAVGSGLAAWLAHGRIVLLPTVVGAFLLGLFAIDVGLATFWAVPAGAPKGAAAIFGSFRGIRLAIDLAGLAIAGGLFIVPVFAAVQAWAGADRRARVIAAVNVLNAGFMVVGTIVFAALQKAARAHPVPVPADRRREPRGRCRGRPHHAGERAARSAVHHLPRLLPHRGARPRQPRQGRVATRSSRSTT